MSRSRVTWVHIPGGGPVGRYCVHCAHVTTTRKSAKVCGKAGQLSRVALDDLGLLEPRSIAACKYFVEREVSDGTGA